MCSQSAIQLFQIGLNAATILKIDAISPARVLLAAFLLEVFLPNPVATEHKPDHQCNSDHPVRYGSMLKPK